MKTAISLAIGLFLFGCVPTKELTQDQTEKVFEHSVQLSKDEIKHKLHLFVNEKFVSGKAVTQTSEDGLFTGNGIVNVYESKGLLGETLNVIKAELTFLVKYDDNKYKVKWIVKDMLSKDGSFSRDMWGYYSENIEKTIKEKDKMMLDYLSDKSNEF